MKIAAPTIAVILDTRRIKADNTYPLKLRLTYQRDRKYYSIGIDLTPALWADVEDKTKTRRELREIRNRINDFEGRAAQVMKGMESFSFLAFEEMYFRSEKADSREIALRNDLAYTFEKIIQQMQEEGRVGTAISYGNALASLTAYRKNSKITDVTPDYLKGYEKKMILAGRSATTVGMYLRALRAVINQAILDGVLTQKDYPFGKNRYVIPSGVNIKKSLTLAEVERIYHYSAIPGSQEEKAKDLWLFSYLCNGVNIKDVCLLKWKNIDGDKIKFIRAKTARTTKSKLRPIIAVLTDTTNEIITRWCNQDRSPEAYVFPFIPQSATPQRELELIHYLIKLVNKYMKRIAEKLKIDKDVTTYFARHSFATVLKRSGAPIEFISESLGHTDLRTTENYLDSFEDDVKREYAKALLNFSKNSVK
ncbi:MULTISPECIES: site-specific integrase [Larkinella]|jgi:integrase/recombinase XerD|uniref:Site-specific integrase n=1 Tax=Larkinella humicola TaxID=2607654 RepID=A0A5N1JL51_9BACT|nr:MULTISPECIES: site-specific integrase [Larkinella]KAA9356851.1 site-specific integrase [Larkinella humicola]